MSEIILTVIGLVVFIGTVAGAAMYITSSVVKQKHHELEVLADTRGDRIIDLEKENDKLRGLQGLKAVEIADEVVARLVATRPAHRPPDGTPDGF